MAERRMFAKSIINSARFLRMPPTSRLLYYDLGMSADDDGIVEAFTVLRTTGAAEDDLRVLAAKGFIRVLNDDLVSLICDWSSNNMIRRDRYTPSIYAGLLVKIEDGNQLATNGEPMVDQRLTQVSIGKVSVSNESDVAALPPALSPGKRFSPPSFQEVRDYCVERENSIDPAAFIDYYSARGWILNGGRVMRDWQAAVRTWERREQQQEGGSGNGLKDL